jgi:hypothetical protein
LIYGNGHFSSKVCRILFLISVSDKQVVSELAVLTVF